MLHGCNNSMDQDQGSMGKRGSYDIYVFKISNEQMASSVSKGLKAGYLQYAAKRIQGMTNDTKNNGQAKWSP